MKKSIAILTIILTISLPLFAGEIEPINEGKLTPEIIADIQKSLKLDPYTKATLNALSQCEIRDLVKNQEVYNSQDLIFSNEIEIKGMTDQQSSGRCWLFATFNLFRQQVIKKYNLGGFEFSENFAMFWDKLEKANLFLEYMIQNVQDKRNNNDFFNDQEVILLMKTPLPDGGFWHMSADVIKKYGAMPKSAMVETHNSENTGRMNALMEKKMRIFAFELRDMAVKGKSLKEMRKRKVEMLKELYRMLVLNLGQSPATFEWRITDKNDSLLPVKTYTPQSFYQEVVGINLDDYAVIGNCPSQPYGKNYRIKLGRGQLEGMDWTFLNMEMGVLKDLAYKTLLDTIPVQLSVDMGQQVDSKVGYMVDGLFDYESLYNLKFGFDKVGWVLTRDSAPNHSMVIVGMDTLNGKPTKWKIENSWGTDRGKDGFFLMSDDWFDKFGYAVVIHKKYIPEDILKLLETTPEELPFWDPLARTISVGGWGE